MDSGVTIHACPYLARSASRVSYSQQQTAPGEDALVQCSNLSAAAMWSNVVTGEVQEVLLERCTRSGMLERCGGNNWSFMKSLMEAGAPENS